MAFDAIGALRDMSDRDGDQLFHLSGKRALLKNGLAELPESCFGVGREAATILSQRLCRPGIKFFAHGISLRANRESQRAVRQSDQVERGVRSSFRRSGPAGQSQL